MDIIRNNDTIVYDIDKNTYCNWHFKDKESIYFSSDSNTVLSTVDNIISLLGDMREIDEKIDSIDSNVFVNIISDRYYINNYNDNDKVSIRIDTLDNFYIDEFKEFYKFIQFFLKDRLKRIKNKYEVNPDKERNIQY